MIDNDSSSVEWGLVEPFEVDDGSLDGIGRAECFSLGVEWGMFRQRLKSGQRFSILCLANNAARLSAMAERHRRFVEYRPATTEGWALITVGDQVV
jgi:hypothetical protein